MQGILIKVTFDLLITTKTIQIVGFFLWLESWQHFFSSPTTKYFVSNMVENDWNAHLKLRLKLQLKNEKEKENLILLERTRRPEFFYPSMDDCSKIFFNNKKSL